MNFSHASLDPVQVTKPGPHADKSIRTFQGVPGVICHESGRLFATWYGGGEIECKDNYLMLACSDDDGKTWTDVLVVVDPPHPDVRAFDPVLWIAPDGRVFWFWAQGCGGNTPNIAKEVFDGLGGVWYSILENPTAPADEFKFTESRRICNGVMMNKPTVLSDGTWALPCSIWTGNYIKHDSLGVKPGAMMVVSTDNGATFEVRGRIEIDGVEGGPSFDEHFFVEKKDGSIACYIRICAGVGQSVSTDGGYTWSKLEVSKEFTAPDTRFYIRRLASGKLLLVTNDSKPKREKLTAFLSDDEGKTWKHKLLLDGEMAVSYPDGMEKDGFTYITYDQNRMAGGFIYLAKFTEADIIAGELVTEGSFLKREINHSKPVPPKQA